MRATCRAWRGYQSSCQNAAQSWISIERSCESKILFHVDLLNQCCLSHKDKDWDKRNADRYLQPLIFNHSS